jgi:hypothetical protein
MRRTVWLTLAVAINAILATVSLAQTNSCISSTDGFWDESRLWSLNKPPSIHQSAILITNDASETVTIDSTTATHFKSTLTISNLVISPPSGSTDALYLDNTGTIALHILNGLSVGVNLSVSASGGGELISSNSTLIVDGVTGGQFEDNGTVVITSGELITTNCSIQLGDPVGFFVDVSVLSISNAIVRARDVNISPRESSSGMIEVFGGTMTLSSSLEVGAGDESSQGSLLVADGALLVVTNGTTRIGDGAQSFGTITVSNATFFAADVFLGGQKSEGLLVINNGTVTLNGQLSIGFGDDQSSGGVFLNGGVLSVTNATTTLGFESVGEMTVSDGLFLALDVDVGPAFSTGTLTVNGGISIISSNLQIGSSDGEYEGTVAIRGGQIFVTNGLITVSANYDAANMVISDGQLVAKTIELGRLGQFISRGMFTVSGGSISVSDCIKLGNCVSNTVGEIIQSGGQLIVTNAAHAGFIDVQNGQLVLSGGVLQVDKLVMTNTCSSFVHTGGTLIAGSVVLDPNAFQITSVAREGNDLRVTWLMAPGSTNALQVSTGGSHGRYVTNNFKDIIIVTNNTTAGTLTNYLDVGAATNFPSRYYRARVSP